MKQYSIKPIRIRFISGGMECASLTQLRNNFVPKDVKDSYSQFQKWLRQNNEKNVINELIESKEVLEGDSIESLFKLYMILYGEVFVENNIEDLYGLCLKWHFDKKNRVSYVYLRDEIKKREWGESFFLTVAQKYFVLLENDVASSQSLFDIYKEFLFDYFESAKISSLIELYIHLASQSSLKINFVFLDNTIKSQEWQLNFYLELIPHLFIPNQKNRNKQSIYNLAFPTYINSLVSTVISNDRTHISQRLNECSTGSYMLLPLENISVSFKSEDETYNFYKFFLGDFLSESKYKTLSDVCLYFLESYMQNENFKVLQDIIKTSDWQFAFTKKCFPLIVNKIHQGIKLCPNKRAFLSVDNADQVFLIYKLFLEDFLRNEHITTLKGLYELWNLNNRNKALFDQLHAVIADSSWCTLFMNELVEDLFKEFKKNHPENSSASNAYSIDEKLFYTNFLCVYFDFYTRNRYINNISDIYTRWANDPKFCEERSFGLLNKVLKNNLWGIWRIIEVYKTHKNIFSDERWFSEFQDLVKFKNENTQFLFEIGRIYINDFKNYEEGCGLISNEVKSNNPEALSFIKHCIKRESNVSEEFENLYILSDKAEWDKNPEGNKKFEIDERLTNEKLTLRERWILITQGLIHIILDDNAYWKIENYVLFMRGVSKNIKLWPYSLESPKSFCDIFDRTDFDRVDARRMEEVKRLTGHSFLELRFVFALICKNHSNNTYRQKGNEILESLRDLYFPAKYLLDYSVKCSALDNIKFREHTRNDINQALREYCQLMASLAKK